MDAYLKGSYICCSQDDWDAKLCGRIGPRNQKWIAKFNDLVEFKEKHGHCWVTYKLKSLAYWVSDQRRRNKKAKLSNEKNPKIE